MEMQLIKPALQTDYLRRLTDDTGIFQHTKFGVPDRTKGYTTDDNARALIAAVMQYKNQRDTDTFDLMHTYVSFIHHAQNEDGSFKNFMGYNRQFIEDIGSEDCLGRCLWALGFTISESSVPDNLQNTCRYMINQALPHLKTLKSPRAQAYAIIGLSFLLETYHSLSYAFPYSHKEKEDETARFLPKETIYSLVDELASRLHLQYSLNKGDGWNWFEDSMTYGNAMLPWALFKAARLSDRADLKETAKESLDFLVSKTFSGDDYFKPIGSDGWQLRHGEAALYDEQPIEACEMLLACREAHKVLADKTYLHRASLCYEWYLGRNSLRVSLIDPQTGGCYDGIHSKGLNLNQGSESIISYTIAQMVMSNE
jgi:hypothetical protein